MLHSEREPCKVCQVELTVWRHDNGAFCHVGGHTYHPRLKFPICSTCSREWLSAEATLEALK